MTVIVIYCSICWYIPGYIYIYMCVCIYIHIYIYINLIERVFNTTWLILLMFHARQCSVNIFTYKSKKISANTKKHTVNTNTHQSQTLQSSITLFKNCLVICQHFSTLIWILTFCLTYLCHLNFLFKLQLLIKVLPLTRLAFENLVVGTAPL